MLTIGAPLTRAARADGIQSTATSALPVASTSDGVMSGPPGRIVTSSPAWRYNPFACATENPADCASASHFNCSTNGSAASAVPNRPKQQAANAAKKVLLNIGSPHPLGDF